MKQLKQVGPASTPVYSDQSALNDRVWVLILRPASGQATAISHYSPERDAPNGLNPHLNEGPSDCGKTRQTQPEGYPTPSQKCMFLFRP